MNELLNYDDEFAKIAERTQHALTKPRISFISTKNKLFTLPDGTSAPRITGVVIDFIRINALMPPWSPNTPSNPKCWALGRDDTSLTPSPNCPEPQVKTSCNECPNNKFRSGANGRGKACKNFYRLAIIAPDATEQSDIAMLKIAPTSLEKWRRYVAQADTLCGKAGFCKIITEFFFDPNKDYPAILFKAVKPYDNMETVIALQNRVLDEIMAEPTHE